MKIFSEIKSLIQFLKFINKDYSPCRIYQILEFQKMNLNKKTIEFGVDSYNESFTSFKKKNDKNSYFSNISNYNKKNYIKINLQKKNKIKKKFDNIIIFNVLEHIYDERFAIKELKKILKKNGKIIISTPFIYRYHQAPEDYKRYTLPYFEKLLKEHNFKIIKKEYLGEGPLIASYSLIFHYIKKIPLISYPIIIIFFIIDKLLSLFQKTNIKQFYPIAILIVAKKI